jgi:hypothetical protein
MRQYLVRMLIILAAVTLTAGGMMATSASDQQAKPQQQTGSSGSQAAKVDLDDLEDNPEKYIGRTVMFEGEVDRVLGPHLFTVDERDWADAERELPVIVPDPFAAIVRSDTPVRVTGVVEKVPIAKIERDWGFLARDPKIKAEIETSPAIVATEVTTIAPVAVNLRVRTDQPVGTSGASTAPITDAQQVAGAKDKTMVGRRVDLKNAIVSSPTAEGFWIRLPSGERIFVMSAKKTAVKEGQTADVQGVLLELPEGLRVMVNGKGEAIYIYADQVTAR